MIDVRKLARTALAWGLVVLGVGIMLKLSQYAGQGHEVIA